MEIADRNSICKHQRRDQSLESTDAIGLACRIMHDGHASRTHDAGTERLLGSLGHHGLDRFASPERDLLMVRHVKLDTRYRNMADIKA